MTAASEVSHNVVRPVAIFVGVALVVAAIVVGIGTALLDLHPHGIVHGDLASEWLRPDLGAAMVASVAVLVGCALLARPHAAAGTLDREVVVGAKPFNAPPPPPLDLTLRQGPLGTVQNIAEGYTLYAQNGALARVIGTLPGEEEYGRRRRGIIYASGLHGANEEMWIPVEAVMSVYPETRAVFLAAKGDEVEHFGWNRPPASFRRDQKLHAAPKSF
ncbi:MAG: hypothetical protein H0U10_13990 [Chloroflexia bacterium]|nr:hypothetical protein [Chloroflexia bacterium]